MSARSANYNAQSTAVLAFLHNYFLQNTTQTKLFDYNTFIYLARTQPQDLLEYDRQYQEYISGGYVPGTVEIVTDNFLGPVVSGIPTSGYYYFAVIKAWDLFNFYDGFNPPRDKYNVRRSYWTGKPRKRMNLP